MELLYEIKYETSFLEDIYQLNKTISQERFIKIIKEFNSKKNILKRFPRMYQKLKNQRLQNNEYRKIVLEKYIIIYKIHSKTIYFLKIFQSKTNYKNKVEHINIIK